MLFFYTTYPFNAMHNKYYLKILKNKFKSYLIRNKKQQKTITLFVCFNNNDKSYFNTV